MPIVASSVSQSFRKSITHGNHAQGNGDTIFPDRESLKFTIDQCGQIRKTVEKTLICEEPCGRQTNEYIRKRLDRGVLVRVQWFPALREELLQFPAGKYGDQVDALSLIGQMLEWLVPGQPDDPEPELIDMTRPVYLYPNGRFSNTLTLENLWQAEGGDSYVTGIYKRASTHLGRRLIR
jgi:hypothetical protein